MVASTHFILFITLSFLCGMFVQSVVSLLLIQIKSCFESLCDHINEVVVFAAACLSAGLGKWRFCYVQNDS